MYIGLHVKYPLFLSISMKPRVSPRQIFEKYSNIKFHNYPPSESRGFPCGWTEWHDEANNRFSQFCERT